MTQVSVNGYGSTHFGVRETDKKFPTKETRYGSRKAIYVPFNYDDLPVASTDGLNIRIPANSYIVSAKLSVVTAFAGGTSYDIGLIQTDGTEGTGDLNGLFATLALASINAVGERAVGAGAQVAATAGTGTNDLVVHAVATGTFTAGVGELVIEYEELQDRSGDS